MFHQTSTPRLLGLVHTLQCGKDHFLFKVGSTRAKETAAVNFFFGILVNVFGFGGLSLGCGPLAVGMRMSKAFIDTSNS